MLTECRLAVLNKPTPITGWTTDEIALIQPIADAPPPRYKLCTEYDAGLEIAKLYTMPRAKDDTLSGAIRNQLLIDICVQYPRAAVVAACKKLRMAGGFMPGEGALDAACKEWRGPQAIMRDRAIQIVRYGRRAKEQNHRPFTQAEIDDMQPEIIALGLKAGYLVERDGRVVDAGKGE